MGVVSSRESRLCRGRYIQWTKEGAVSTGEGVARVGAWFYHLLDLIIYLLMFSFYCKDDN